MAKYIAKDNCKYRIHKPDGTSERVAPGAVVELSDAAFASFSDQFMTQAQASAAAAAAKALADAAKVTEDNGAQKQNVDAEGFAIDADGKRLLKDGKPFKPEVKAA